MVRVADDICYSLSSVVISVGVPESGVCVNISMSINRTLWATQHALSSDHLHIITTINIRQDYRVQTTTKPRNFHQLHYSRLDTNPLSLRPPYPQAYTLPTANIMFTNIILMADKHNIPKDKMHSNCRLLPDHIVCKITQRNNGRRANGKSGPHCPAQNKQISLPQIILTQSRRQNTSITTMPPL